MGQWKKSCIPLDNEKGQYRKRNHNKLKQNVKFQQTVVIKKTNLFTEICSGNFIRLKTAIYNHDEEKFLLPFTNNKN